MSRVRASSPAPTYSMTHWTNSKKRERRQYWQDTYKRKKGCQECGYNKHPRALSFDHIDPATKHPITKNGKGSTRAGGMWQLLNPKYSVKTLINEWRKCRVLCFNCHMEKKYHYVK